MRSDVKMLWDRFVGDGLSEGEEVALINHHLEKHPKERLQWYVLYLETKYWKKVREIIMKRDGERCARCYSVYDLQVHHHTYPRVFGQERVDNLQTLCMRCHQETSKFNLGGSTKARMLNCAGDVQLFVVLRKKVRR